MKTKPLEIVITPMSLLDLNLFPEIKNDESKPAQWYREINFLPPMMKSKQETEITFIDIENSMEISQLDYLSPFGLSKTQIMEKYFSQLGNSNVKKIIV